MATAPTRPAHRPSPGVLITGCSETIVFLTVTTENRAPWLADPEAHRVLAETWQTARGWLVGGYVLMPDHLHCFCVPGDRVVAIERWLAYWKDQFRKKHGHPEWRWQSRGWHHRLRSTESFAEKWDYVRQNPVRAGLVLQAEAWPYQGQIHPLGIK